MFQFTTTTLINEAVDFTTGLPRWEIKQDTDGNDYVHIKRAFTLKPARVSAIYKRAYSAPVLAAATFDMSAITQDSGVFRILLYIRLSGSQNSYYSNDFVFKGKPLAFEFVKNDGDTPQILATRVAAQIQQEFARFGYTWVNVTPSGTNVVVSARDEYQRFKVAKLQWLDPDGREINCTCSTDGFTDLAEAEVKQGAEGFGTYQHLSKDLRLPTGANRRWIAIAQDDMPIMGATYNQYTIYYEADRGILGTNAVGDLVTSRTYHVFYVQTSLATAFETILAALETAENGGLQEETRPPAPVAQEVTISPTSITLSLENDPPTATAEVIAVPEGTASITTTPTATVATAAVSGTTITITPVGIGQTEVGVTVGGVEAKLAITVTA